MNTTKKTKPPKRLNTIAAASAVTALTTQAVKEASDNFTRQVTTTATHIHILLALDGLPTLNTVQAIREKVRPFELANLLAEVVADAIEQGKPERDIGIQWEMAMLPDGTLPNIIKMVRLFAGLGTEHEIAEDNLERHRIALNATSGPSEPLKDEA